MPSKSEQKGRRSTPIWMWAAGPPSAVVASGRSNAVRAEIELERRAAPVEHVPQPADAVRLVVHHLGFDGAGHIGGRQIGERHDPTRPRRRSGGAPVARATFATRPSKRAPSLATRPTAATTATATTSTRQHDGRLSDVAATAAATAAAGYVRAARCRRARRRSPPAAAARSSRRRAVPLPTSPTAIPRQPYRCVLLRPSPAPAPRHPPGRLDGAAGDRAARHRRSAEVDLDRRDDRRRPPRRPRRRVLERDRVAPTLADLLDDMYALASLAGGSLRQPRQLGGGITYSFETQPAATGAKKASVSRATAIAHRRPLLVHAACQPPGRRSRGRAHAAHRAL